MPNIKELRQEQAELAQDIQRAQQAAQAILTNGLEAGAKLTDEQEAIYQELEDGLNTKKRRATEIGTMMARWESLQEKENQLPVVRRGRDTPEPDPVADKPKPLKLFASFGEQLKAIQNAATMGLIDPRLHQLNAAALGAGEAVGSDGGFLLQSDFSAEVFRRMVDGGGEILSRVRRVPVSGNGLVMPVVDETSRVTGSRWGGVQGYHVDEGTAPTASRPRFARLELKLHKVAAVGYSTDELVADASAMTTIFTEAFADELRWIVENAIVRGSGAGQALGILNAPALVSVAKEVGQAADTVEPENIIKMWARMYSRSRLNAAWFINQDIEPSLHTMSLGLGTAGLAVYMPPGGLSQAPYATLMGRPVIPVEYCSTLGDQGDIILADFSQVIMIDKGGVQQDTSMHVRFLQDELTFRALYRYDAQPLWRTALTPANGSNTQSPFIVLDARA